ncbi:MAG: hypothetical protein R3C46_08625 [Hyphomonadaceae bacterium]
MRLTMTLALSTGLMIAAGPATAQQPASPPPACTSEQHRAFDFWIGEWEAYVTGTDQLAGLSTIKAEDGGCVITEHWRSQRASYSGRSLNIYDAIAGRWEQFWVDSTGDLTHFIGNPTATGMQLTAEDDHSPGQSGAYLSRMTFTRNDDGSVRQHGQISTDRGATWSDRYDFTYTPAKTP